MIVAASATAFLTLDVESGVVVLDTESVLAEVLVAELESVQLYKNKRYPIRKMFFIKIMIEAQNWALC